ncbi:hypothetical protein ACFW9D_02400 [Streptomyces sp. NPDC059524]|uniref:hypothetical protein n=1 Tax=Streptomyces sp. NPDC059524 TaxID=3346856 RepID=UPI00368D6B2E
MSRQWRKGTIDLLTGYAVFSADGRRVSRVTGVDFAIEGGFVNIRVPGVPRVQLVSAPAVRLITVEEEDEIEA